MAKGKYQKWLTQDGRILLESWARDGLKDEQIAAKMGINVATLYRYKNDHCEICDALKKGKEVVDVEVENALLKRALGFEFMEEKVEMETDMKGKVLGRKVTQTVKQVAPDVGAAVFWLKNRQAPKWRNNPSSDDDNTGQLETLLKGLQRNG